MLILFHVFFFKKTIDRWAALEGTARAEMEMEISGGGVVIAGALDSKTYDFNTLDHAVLPAAAPPKTINAAADMSLVTGDHAGAATMRFETNMSGIQEESDAGASVVSATSAPLKTVNAAASMDLDDDDEENELHEDEMTAQHNNINNMAKTVNFAADMELATAAHTGHFHPAAQTTNFVVPMEVDSDEENVEEDQSVVVGDALNEGFTKDWAASNNGAKTVNFAAPMDLVEEEEESSSGEVSETDNNFPVHWSLTGAASGPHLAAADAVRKSLEQGCACVVLKFFLSLLKSFVVVRRVDGSIISWTQVYGSIERLIWCSSVSSAARVAESLVSAIVSCGRGCRN